ncbi:MAG TPA: sugar phosphate isomerase/epimerase [Candidatus Dormibacteraeota bacterium]|jgi:sugar phosphate isomerase/epimerase|nr:sugar phosphate isomerase/epimerase [Candidatus Dormibacteraeota bacterium]
MRLSCLTALLGEVPLDTAFAQIGDAGFDAVDIRGDLLHQHRAEVSRLIGSTALPVATVYGRVTIPMLSAAVEDRARSVALIRERLGDAAAVGAPNLIVVPVFGEARIHSDLGRGVEDVELSVLSVLLEELAPVAAENRVRIVLEPLNRKETHLLRSPARTADLTRRLGSEWVGTMADTYHMDLELEDAEAEVEGAYDQLHLVHLSDRNRTLPGKGGIDFAPFLHRLEGLGYDGYGGYECNGPFSVEQLKESVEWVKAQ